MIRLKRILYEGGKLFAPHSQRITTDEMYKIYDEIESDVSNLFNDIQLVRSLESKKDHGDIDILLLVKSGSDWINNLKSELRGNILDYSKNGRVYSFLYVPKSVNKKVHIDFIAVGDANKFKSMTQYYILNDFSGVIGIIAKKLNFQYGSDGFKKRFKDKKGNWHSIDITNDLIEGLKILGYKNPKEKINNITNLDEMVEFIMECPLLDYSLFDLTGEEKKILRQRSNIDYVIEQIKKRKPKASIEDSEYFLKKLYPKYYEKVQKQIEKINKNTYIQSKYNGKWILNNFNIKPGPIIGQILKKLTDKFGDDLDNTDESVVYSYVKDLLK